MGVADPRIERILVQRRFPPLADAGSPLGNSIEHRKDLLQELHVAGVVEILPHVVGETLHHVVA